MARTNCVKCFSAKFVYKCAIECHFVQRKCLLFFRQFWFFIGIIEWHLKSFFEPLYRFCWTFNRATSSSISRKLWSKYCDRLILSSKLSIVGVIIALNLHALGSSKLSIGVHFVTLNKAFSADFRTTQCDVKH